MGGYQAAAAFRLLRGGGDEVWGLLALRRAAASGEGLVENLLGDVENAHVEDIFAKSGGGKRKKRTEKACGG